MALTQSTAAALGKAPSPFSLLGVDGKTWSLGDFASARVLVVVFMCNHCPYVVAVRQRINALAAEYGPCGVRLVAINSNDPVKFPDDNFTAMKADAKKFGYVFPYLFDETQEVARAYDAVCTPDFFVYGKSATGFELSYRGRLDDSWKDPTAVKRRDLALALEEILAGNPVAGEQIPSMGCSIKWK